jgi:hypothetical protein
MLDLITVVYREELPLLKIQARSLDLYIKKHDINSITVVINDLSDVDALVDSNWYGQHNQLVKIQRFPLTSLSGWDSQQLYKLCASSKSTVEWSMILDAKTWLINHLELSKVLDDSARAYHCPIENYASFNAFNAEFRFVQDFFNVDANNTMIGPAGVPYMFHNKTVKSLITSIENITNQPFETWFTTHVANPPLVTEFILYSIYVLYKYGNYDTLYAKLDQPNYLYYNVCDWEVPIFDNIYSQIKNSTHKVLTASVHRRAYSLLSQEQKQKWLELLRHKQLINDDININTLY